MPYTITMAPRVIKGGKIIIGVSGGEYAVRGFFSAYEADTGKMAWRFYTVPGDPSKPFEHPDLEAAAKTWSPSQEWWKLGGGAGVWNGMAYDGDNDIVYVGTGQPGPWTDTWRGPGDNLYANSIVAVRGATGKLVWYYQEVPGDNWDYDSIADLMLLDLNIGGRRRQVIMHAPKSGFFYVLDRVTGEFISGDPITKVSWSSGFDAKGKPIVNPGARYGTTPVTVMPGPSGGHVWQPWTYSPLTGLVYFPGAAGGSSTYRAAATFQPNSTDVGPTGRGQMNMGTGGGGGGGRGRGGNNANTPADLPAAVAAANVQAGGAAPAPPVAPAAPPAPLPVIGPDGVTGSVLYAWDPVARKERWRAQGGGAGPFAGGSLSTAGNLVFSSVNNRLLGYNAQTGDKVFDMDLGTAQMGPPISFAIDGQQYIAVTAGPGGGGGGRGGGGGGRDAGAGGGAQAAPRPANLFVLGLDGKAPLPGAAPQAVQ
jgi:quinohemoprotein ethanol dehydrogenase